MFPSVSIVLKLLSDFRGSLGNGATMNRARYTYGLSKIRNWTDRYEALLTSSATPTRVRARKAKIKGRGTFRMRSITCSTNAAIA